MFAILDKAKPDTGNVRGIKLGGVQGTRLPCSEFRRRRNTSSQAERLSIFQDGLGSSNLDLDMFQIIRVASIIESRFYMESR
jgi:hypothetical protein